MYYYKTVDGAELKHPWDASRARTTLSFAHRLHDPALALGPLATRQLVADAAAASIAQAFATKALSSQHIGELLSYCHLAVQDLGYSTETIEGIQERTEGRGKNVMIVLGTQSLKGLHARVDAAVRVLRRLPAQFEVVCAGANPAPDGKPTALVNEAREANVYLASVRDSDPSLAARTGMKQWIEPASTNTKGNIKQFFEGGLLDGLHDKQVFLVSSTFHLMRVAAELEAYRDVMQTKHVKALVLVGSESVFGGDMAGIEPEYVKSMAYEVFFDILKNAGGQRAT